MDSDEEKKMLELRVKVEPGSSILEIFIEEIAKAVGDKVRSMTPKQVIATVATVAVVAAASVTMSKYIDSKTEIARLREQNKIVTDVQKASNEAAIAIIEAQSI